MGESPGTSHSDACLQPFIDSFAAATCYPPRAYYLSLIKVDNPPLLPRVVVPERNETLLLHFYTIVSGARGCTLTSVLNILVHRAIFVSRMFAISVSVRLKIIASTMQQIKKLLSRKLAKHLYARDGKDAMQFLVRSATYFQIDDSRACKIDEATFKGI